MIAAAIMANAADTRAADSRTARQAAVLPGQQGSVGEHEDIVAGAIDGAFTFVLGVGAGIIISEP